MVIARFGWNAKSLRRLGNIFFEGGDGEGRGGTVGEGCILNVDACCVDHNKPNRDRNLEARSERTTQLQRRNLSLNKCGLIFFVFYVISPVSYPGIQILSLGGVSLFFCPNFFFSTTREHSELYIFFFCGAKKSKKKWRRRR